MVEKRIGIIRRNSGEFGGIEHQVVNIASYLHKQYKFFLITDDAESKMAKEFSQFGKVIAFPFAQRNFLKIGKMISNLCEQEGISIIQSHMPRESFYGRAAKYYNKKLIHIYRVHTYIDCSFIPKWKKNIYHYVARATDRYVDKYLSINNANKKELMERSHVSSEKIEVIHNGVRPVIAKKDDMELDEKNHNFAIVGNFLWERGYDIALRALEILLRNVQSYKLILIGGENSANHSNIDGTIKRRIVNLAEELGVSEHVKFYGFTDDIAEALKDISMVILPAYDAGTPNCLLEAMSIHKLVVASDVGGIPEFIFNGKNGFLHKNKDYEELAKIIKSIDDLSIEDLMEIKKSGYKIWYDEYSIDALKSNLERIYSSFGR